MFTASFLTTTVMQTAVDTGLSFFGALVDMAWGITTNRRQEDRKVIGIDPRTHPRMSGSWWV